MKESNTIRSAFKKKSKGSAKHHPHYLQGAVIYIYSGKPDRHILSNPVKCPNCKMLGCYYYRPEVRQSSHRCTKCEKTFLA